MGNILFIMGTLLFFTLGALIVYWLSEIENYTYYSIGCEYIMAILIWLYHIKGSSVFGKLPHHCVVFYISIIFMFFIILYIGIYIFEEEFEKKLLLLIPLFVLEIWQIITVWSNVKKDIIVKETNVMTWFWASICFVFAIYHIYYLMKRESEVELFRMRYYRSNSTLPFDFYIRNSDISGDVSDNISNLVIKLYHYAKENRLSYSLLCKFLSHYEKFIPRDVKEKVIERFMESHYLNRMDSINLIEFATILFPEFFGNPNKAYSSERYNVRLFEEYYMLSKRFLDRSQTQWNELNSKMSKIEEILSGKIENHTYDTKKESIFGAKESEQSIVREIFHLTKTPLLTINIVVKNLLGNSESENELSEKQKKKLATIMDNVSTVKLIMEAYRKLVTASNVPTNEDIVSYIKTAITAMCGVCKKQVKHDISDFPKKISVHGNNVIIILLIPLIHNAIEASPDKGNLVVKCIEKEDNYTITIANTCEILPKQKDLNMDGFSSKENGGEGLRSVRRISKSIGIKFQIKVYNKNNKVVATLIVPKK